MSTSTTHRGRTIAVLAVCALSLSLVAAAPGTAESAQTLLNEQVVAATLTGNRAGAFGYYQISYPGNASVVTIQLRFTPGDPVTKSAVGFNVYGPNGFHIGQGVDVAATSAEAIFELAYADTNPATWLIQVYNYLPGATISYQIKASGLPAYAAAPPSAPAVTPPPASQPVVSTALDASGFLTGNGGGAYSVHKVTVSAAGRDIEVTLNWSPDDPVIAQGVGMVVYGPTGQVIQGAATGRPGERVATLSASSPGDYQVQLYNYIPGLTIQYTLRGVPVGE
jgi:hypothetical protein